MTVDWYLADLAVRAAGGLLLITFACLLLSFLKKQNRVVPLSEISDHFAFSQLYPGHLESACEWLERKGLLEKVSAPFKLTKRSQQQVEEPAYLLDDLKD